MFTLAAQFQHSERVSAAQLEKQQHAQLSELLSYSAANVPYYRERLRKVLRKRGGVDWQRWQALLRLKRQDIQNQFSALTSRSPPSSHGNIRQVSTSGSTGTPLRVYESMLQRMLFGAAHLRKYRWHGTDYAADVASTRRLAKSDSATYGEKVSNNWRAGIKTGSSHSLDISAPVDIQMAWLARIRPRYLNTFPTNLAALLEEIEKSKADFGFLQQCHTLGEVVTDDLRVRCDEVLGIPIIDAYTSIELGVISLQAPGENYHHVMSETHFVEVLKSNGDPCKAGEIGRVVVTPLHNFAMPLIRYECGDYAEVGESPEGAISLPVLNRIIGRSRNMAYRPDGTKFWPALNGIRWREVAEIEQVQFVQHTKSSIELKLVGPGELNSDQKAALALAVDDALRASYDIEFTLVHTIPRGAGGKFEDFISLVEQ